MNIPLAELLIDIEAQLRQLGQWDKVAPEADRPGLRSAVLRGYADVSRSGCSLSFCQHVYGMLGTGESCLRAAVSRQWLRNTYRGTGLSSWRVGGRSAESGRVTVLT